MSTTSAMWDERFKHGNRPYGTESSLYLQEKVGLIRPGGRVLLPGDGGGRNGVWLARQGFEIEIWDFSAEALATARQWATECGVRVVTRRVDVGVADWPKHEFDAVVSIYLHLPSVVRRRVHHGIMQALRPGGVFILEAFHVDQMACSSGGPRDLDMLLNDKKLDTEFPVGEIVDIRRDEVVLNESALHRGPGVLVRAVIRA